MEFHIEFLRPSVGREVLATFRDGVALPLNTRLADTSGTVWRVLGEAGYEVRLVAEGPVMLGSMPKGAFFTIARSMASPGFLPMQPPARYAVG